MTNNNIGITGTREGMNSIQKLVFLHELKQLTATEYFLEFRHGQCKGVDVETAQLVKDTSKLKIVSHPPINKKDIGICQNDILLKEKGYLERNRDIVDNSEIMFVIPNTEEHQTYGGTWYTFDYIIKKRKKFILILPSGFVFRGV